MSKRNTTTAAEPVKDQVVKTAEKAVAVVADKNTAVTAPAPPAADIDFAADAGLGVAFGATDLAIPFLVILQKNSPQVDEDNPKYLRDAKAAMIYNTVTGELFDGKTKGVLVVPTGYQKKYVEWISRDDGGGFVGQHEAESDAVRACRLNDRGKLETPDGHQMIETAYHYVVLIDPNNGSSQWAVISMASSQLKKSRKWNTLIAGITMTKNGQTFKPPIFSHMYQLKTVLEQKDTNTWYGWDINNAGIVSDRRVYDSAKQYCQALLEGSVRVTAPPAVDAEETGGTERVPF
ncbi:MAG: hypothetical protein E6Q97_26585 [Desulfurellales bacterium]|nr:MAG: hypothetical protein E6Q97_26585 [Desulfurellales bacterium]